jgi:autotransporter-associated beta strand protein
VIGSLSLSGRDDQLHLYTDSSITGSISGAGGTDALTLNGSGSGLLASAIGGFETLTKQDAGTWTLNGPIGVSSTSSTPLIVAVQAGTLVLTGANTYRGGTMLNTGTLVVGNSSALGTGMLTMAAGTTLSFLNTGNFALANNITMSGNATIAPPGGTTQALAGVIADGGAPGTLTMPGPGALELDGANTYSGGTILSAGTLIAGNNGALGIGPLAMAAGTFSDALAELKAPMDTRSDQQKVRMIVGGFAAGSISCLNSAAEYCIDAWQRRVLLLDVLRQRGNNYLEHNARKAPRVLSFGAELVLDGRKFKRPVSYALVRIVPPDALQIDDRKRARSSFSIPVPVTARGSAA